MEKVFIKSVYRFTMERLNENTFVLVPLAKVGNHPVMNGIFNGETQIKVIGPLQGIEGLTTYLFHQKLDHKVWIVRKLILNIPEGTNLGYGRLEPEVPDAVLVRAMHGEFEVIIIDGERSLTLQYFQMLKDGKLDHSIASLLSYVPY